MIALTGATGFIGQQLAKRLIDSGYRLRALVRDPARAALPPGVDAVPGSLEDPDALQRLCQDVEALVHCAGSVRGACREDFDAVNVAGQRRVIRALQSQAPDAYLLCLSSLAAREPDLSHYAASKRRGEQVVTDEFPRLRAGILRPPAVYGPGDRELLPLFRLMARGIAPLPGAARARLSLLHVEDLADAVVACLAQRTAGRFELSDGRPGGYDWGEIAAVVGELCDRPVRLLPIPARLLDGAARVNRWRARLTGFKPMLSPEKLRELRHPDWVADHLELAAATGWQPRLQLAAGLAATPGWRPPHRLAR